MTECSPPSGEGQTPTVLEAGLPTGEVAALPPQLIEELSALMASALGADFRQYPNLAEVQQKHTPTVESLRGLNRPGRYDRRRAAEHGTTAVLALRAATSRTRTWA
jgi:hypothetical protein